jgi:hypothetical protein
MRSSLLVIPGLAFALLSACHSGSDDDGIVFDGPPPDMNTAVACNAFEQTGCDTGEKCTWVNIDSTNDLGTIKCVPDGSVADGGACTVGADGETTGFDNCVGGEICIGGTCEPICTISPDSCDSDHSCERYTGLFTGATPELGACDPKCDPVTQEVLTTPPTAACGGTGTGINATRGCYGQFDTNFSCAGVPSMVTANPGNYAGEGDTAYGPAAGGAYLNGCAPGYAPLLRSANDATAPVVCMAFCLPGPTHVGQVADAGGQAGSGFTCGDRGELTQQCEYFWIFETVDPTNGPLHPDGVGFCFTPENYVGDWDGNAGTPDTAWPRCTTLADADTDGDGTRDDLFWGCVPYAAAAQGVAKHAHLPFGLQPAADLEKRDFH